MKKLLTEGLIDYNKKFQANQSECIRLMKKGLPWKAKAREGAGLKLMIEATIIELKSYS